MMINFSNGVFVQGCLIFLFSVLWDSDRRSTFIKGPDIFLAEMPLGQRC